MMLACSALIAIGDFEFAKTHGIFDHHAAAFPAPVLKRLQPAGDAVRADDLLRQHDRVLDADAGARGQVRGRGVNGVADQDDASLRPGLREKQRLERPVDNARLIIQQNHGWP